ncbi:MAG TPA: glycosyltransferase [Bacteroidales bacterium]|nr:glycosyltransferase [Bacteroidales bacterium]
MKIAYLSSFHPYRGGIAQFNTNLYDALQKDHQVWAYNFSRQYPGILFPGKSQYVNRDEKNWSFSAMNVLDSINPLTYYSTARKIATKDPDLLLLRYWMPFFAPSLGTVAKKLKKKCRVVSILDNVIPHEPRLFDKELSKWFLKQNDGCVCLSESVRDDMLSLRKGIPNIILPHPLYDHYGAGIDKEEAAKQLGIDTRLKTLLFFGFIRNYKGLDLLIDAFGKLDGSYQLLVGGECYGSFERYEKQIASSPNADRIKIFNRYISDAEVPLFFSAADVCILPYRSATQSGITAMACHFEVPLIATKVGGLGEAIEEPGLGLMVPQLSSTALAETINLFFSLNRNEFIRNIGKEKDLLSWTRFASGLAEFAADL